MKPRLLNFFAPVLVAWALAASGTVWALAPDFEAPFLSRPVMDEARILSDADLGRIEPALRGLREATGVHMVVYLPSSLQGYDIESFSMTVAEQWKLGKKGEDKGLLLVVAPRERRMRLEVGYGLEGTLTDAMSRRILDEVLRPFLRDGRTAEGFVAVVGAVAQAMGSQYQPEGMPTAPARRSRAQRVELPFWVKLVILVFFVVFSIVMRLARPLHGWSRRPGYWRQGGGGGFGGFGGLGGGGGWGGGGGGFGGGGASSRW
ncbi:MAG: TPM domain-containing protein [Oligoflexia bacterium]